MSLWSLLGIDPIATECDLPVWGYAKTPWQKALQDLSIWDTVCDAENAAETALVEHVALCFSRSRRHRLPSVTWWHNLPSLWNGAVKKWWSVTSVALIQTLESTGKHLRLCRVPVSDEGSRQEVLARIAQTTDELTSLMPIWKEKNIGLRIKLRLLCSLVISIFLYACESWTLTLETCTGLIFQSRSCKNVMFSCSLIHSL